MADSLRVFEALRAHLPEAHARSVTAAIQQAETDIGTDLRSAVATTFAQCASKADLADVKGELKAEVAAVRGEMKAGFAELRKDLAETKTEMIRWMLIFWAGQLAGSAALLRLWK